MSREALAFPPLSAPRSVWVFLLDVEPDALGGWEAPSTSGEWRLPAALGVDSLDPESVEVFPEERISEYGMARYLVEANGMDPNQVAEDLQILESLSGVIVLVHSKAVAGKSGAFDPAHPARFVGHYSEPVTLSAAVPHQPNATTSGEILGAASDTPMQFPWRIISIGAAVLVLLTLLLWSLA